MTLTVTFKLGTDVDNAQVHVQNRVAQAQPKLPEEVRRIGVTVTTKSTPDLPMVVHILSPDNRYDQTYLSNFVALHIKDELARLDGVGDVQQFGGGNYSMRIWLDWPGSGERVSVRPGEPRARLSGSPGELLLYVFGRQPVAQVEIGGTPEAIAALRRTHLGM